MDCGQGKNKVLIEYWDAQRIRQLYRTKQKNQSELAAMYGISIYYVYLILKNKRLPEPEPDVSMYVGILL